MSETTDFSKAMNKAKIQMVLSRFKGANPELLSFYTVTKLIKPRSETYIGLKPIKVADIIGSEGRYSDFSSAFFPKKQELKRRWESIENANSRDIILPPISVYKLGDKYFVRDGNHRVSVAKATGVEFIDAEIVELDSKVPLTSGMTIQDIVKEVCEYERQRFIDQYHPDYLPMDEIVFTSVGSYPEMVQHILVHKYYINQKIDHELSFEYAARSWYENLYKPIVEAVEEEHMLLHFPGKTKGDLYIWVIRHWDNLKHEGKPDISIKAASEDYERRFGKGTLRRWWKWLTQRFTATGSADK